MTDPATWELGVAVLTATGIKERTARAMMGKWLSTWEESDVVAAIQASAGKADPPAYARKILKSKRTKQATQMRLEERAKEQASLPTPQQAREIYSAKRELWRQALRGAPVRERVPGEDDE